jgi:hypothetical protein
MRPRRSLSQGDVSGIAGGDEQSSMVGLAVSEATGKQQKRAKNAWRRPDCLRDDTAFQLDAR